MYVCIFDFITCRLFDYNNCTTMTIKILLYSKKYYIKNHKINDMCSNRL